MLKPDVEPEAGRWFYVSDTHVTEVTMDRVLRARAYLLFYERVLQDGHDDDVFILFVSVCEMSLNDACYRISVIESTAVI